MTIATTVCFHNFLPLPPVMGMLTGPGYLQIFGFLLKRSEQRAQNAHYRTWLCSEHHSPQVNHQIPFLTDRIP